MSRLQHLPPLHNLLALEAAARLGSFTLAARELGLTPSAVSHRIRQLESTSGAPLFERLPGRVRATPHGEQFLARVRHAIEALELLLPEPPSTLPRRVRVGVPPTFGRNVLIPALPNFYAGHPGHEVEVIVVSPLAARPERHDLDIRFGLAPFDHRPAERLFEDELAVYAAPGFIRQHAIRGLSDLGVVPLLRSPLIDWKPWLRVARLGLRPRDEFAPYSDLGMMMEAAASGRGVALCPQRIAQIWLATGQVEKLFALTVPSSSTYHLLTDDEATPCPARHAFSAWLRAAMRAGG